MVTQEEAKVKLSMDTTVVGTAKRQIADFAETGHIGFVKASNGAKEFKKAMREIADQSPILGGLLRFALSPIGGVLMGATAAFGYFNKKIEELNKLLDEMETRAARPMGDMAKSAKEAAEQFAKLNKEFRDWLRGHDKPQDQIKGKLEEQLEIMQSQKRVAMQQLESYKEIASQKLKMSGSNVSAMELDYARTRHKMELDFVAAELRAKQDAVRSLRQLEKQAASEVLSHEAALKDSGRLGLIADLPKRIKDMESARDELKNSPAYKKAKEDLDEAERGLSEKRQLLIQQPSNASARRLAQQIFDEAKENYEKMKVQVDGYTKAIEANERALKKAKDAQEGNQSALKAAQTNYDAIRGQADALAVALGKAQLQMNELMQMGPAATGAPEQRGFGIPYRPIQPRPLQYHPIPGAPGYHRLSPAIPAVEPAPSQVFKGVDEKMGQLLDLAASRGIKIQIPDE